MILEEILAQVGNSGRFQVFFAAIVFSMEIIISWSMLQTAILGATPEWWCAGPEWNTSTNTTTLTTTSNNTIVHACTPLLSATPAADVNGYHGTNGSLGDVLLSSSSPRGGGGGGGVGDVCERHFDPSLVSVVSEWDLVCERRHVKAVINSVQMAGVLVGAVLCGQSSDTVGRRITFYVTVLLHALTCILAGLSTSWQVYAALRFFVGAAIGSYLVLHYVYVIEFVSHTWRPYMASIPTWHIGASLMCLTAWKVPHWRYLHFICGGLSVPMLLGWFLAPESVRWLAAKGKVVAAEAVVEKIAKMNGRTKAPDTSEQLALLAEEERRQGEKDRKYAYHTLFQGWRNATKTLILAFAWMSLSMSYYGIIFGVSALSGNVFLNMFLLSVAEVPLTILTSVLVVRTRVEDPSEENKGTIISAVAICSKLFIAVAWTCMQTFTAELYPTVIRSLGLGAANTAARLGGILAPFVLEMDTADDAVKCYVIVGSIMAVSAVLVLLLGETKGKALADTLHQNQKELDL
ncbi:solute carrier family 22 member 16-like [Babylonia areolata]|uniref:solute carrier family 22 member 16-like n=1 Tax=Babylonia areolata TaxID=304850 RepID=UPI003FD51514